MQNTSPEGREINTNMSSLLHGYLINNLDDTYSHKMHESTLRHFSQYIARKEDGWQWIVSTLTDEAEEHIIDILGNYFFDSKLMIPQIKFKRRK